MSEIEIVSSSMIRSSPVSSLFGEICSALLVNDSLSEMCYNQSSTEGRQIYFLEDFLNICSIFLNFSFLQLTFFDQVKRNFYLILSNVGNQNKKALMLYLSKEATNKDVQLKSQLVMTFQDDESKGSQQLRLESGFFGDQRAELTILKANFPENSFYILIKAPFHSSREAKKQFI